MNGINESVIRLLDIALVELTKIDQLFVEMFEAASKK